MEFVPLLGVCLTVITAMAVGYAYFRSSAVKVWEQNSEAYRARVELLEQANKALQAQVGFMENRIHELEARPDWTQVVALMSTLEGNIIKAVEKMRQETRDAAA